MKLYCNIELENHYILVLEYCNGGDLKSYLHEEYSKKVERYGLPEEIVQNFMQQIASAVATMFSKNIVHRDLKLANICVHHEGEEVILKISDFGLART